MSVGDATSTCVPHLVRLRNHCAKSVHPLNRMRSRSPDSLHPHLGERNSIYPAKPCELRTDDQVAHRPVLNLNQKIMCIRCSKVNAVRVLGEHNTNIKRLRLQFSLLGKHSQPFGYSVATAGSKPPSGHHAYSTAADSVIVCCTSLLSFNLVSVPSVARTVGSVVLIPAAISITTLTILPLVASFGSESGSCVIT